MIKLTNAPNSKTFWMNPDKIVAVARMMSESIEEADIEKGPEYTHILLDDSDYFNVIETPERIVDLIAEWRRLFR